VSYKNEMQMYPDVTRWLKALLTSKLPGYSIEVRDTHASPLNEYIQRHGLQNYFSNDLWQTYDIRVDITAFVKLDSDTGLIFVECKTVPISLLHLSQLLGYSRVALPLFSYLLSSAGIGGTLRSLLTRYDRTDILEYHWQKGQLPRRILVARWDANAKGIDSTSVLPPGSSGQL
jgi:hypothetical protein